MEWSINEKVALEVGAGAAMAGVRTLVTMKQVGLNVASDPLMSLNYTGVKGGMVIVVADDPGPISSQTEQDTRHFGIFAKLAVFDPSSPEEAYLMIADAFELSERFGRPVLFRPTTRICHGRATIETLPPLPVRPNIAFEKSPRWVIFPRLSAANKPVIENNLKQLSVELSSYPRNSVDGKGKLGIACGGTCYAYVKEALRDVTADYKLFKVSAYPFPEKKALEFMNGLDEVLCVEELDPVIENQLVRLCGLHNIKLTINGKRSGHVQNVGEITPDIANAVIKKFLNVGYDDPVVPENPPQLPIRPPVMCAGCLHRAAFHAVKEAVGKRKAVFSGDIGCYTLGNAPPLEMVDTCICMGGGITAAQGLSRAEPKTLNFAFIGDSTFFHSGITGVINAVYNRTEIIVVILDNDTTAMTGGQPHPGTGQTMMNTKSDKISIHKIVEACGVDKVIVCNPFEVENSKGAVSMMLDESGVRVIIFEAPCVSGMKIKKKFTVVNEKCTSCRLCITKLGCPSITYELISPDDGYTKPYKSAVISADTCTGCGVCASVCTFGAIKEVK